MLPSAEFSRRLDRSTTRRESGTKVGQLFPSGYKVFSVWRAGGWGADCDEMKVLLLYPEFPDTFWSYKHALKFIRKRAALPPLSLLSVAAMLPENWVNTARNECSGYT
jgi:hypothetical protein